MKKVNASKLTPEQCADELTLMEVEKLLKKARKAEQKASEELQKVYQAIEDMCIELDTPTAAENADTLEEAINCFVHYGEFSLSGLMDEIRRQYAEVEHED